MTTGGVGNQAKDPRIVAAEVQQAEAAALKAATEAAAAQRQEREAMSEAALAQREAERRKAVAEADKAVSDARQTQIASLIPDFSKVSVPAAKIEGDQAVRGNDLARHALRGAASKAADQIKNAVSGSGLRPLVLVTSDQDLATADGAYVEVDAGLTHLTESAESLLPVAQGADFGITLAAAAAYVLPGLLSMLAPRQTLSSRSIADDDTAAVAAISGALIDQCDVHIDDFRLVPAAGLLERERYLRQRRNLLAQYKLSQDRVRIDGETRRAELAERLTALNKQKDASNGAPTQGLLAEIAEVTAARDSVTAEVSLASVTADTVNALVTAIDAFFIAIHTTAAGAKRSAFVSGALHEALRVAVDGKKFDAVVYVKSAGGSVDQRIEELFLRKDRIESTASVSVSYWAINPATSNVLVSGVETGTVRLSGELGGDVTLTYIESP
ncbi:MAG TPA: hypothetical protein VGB75_01420 [Jatrophihabitans sp.]|jgi:hypothetical protein|uniref:hypothetical protein n=1 Tax=Jatrophihabitans sp. TaxID=1932789 RepID=UPI002EFA5808